MEWKEFVTQESTKAEYSLKPSAKNDDVLRFSLEFTNLKTMLTWRKRIFRSKKITHGWMARAWLINNVCN